MWYLILLWFTWFYFLCFTSPLMTHCSCCCIYTADILPACQLYCTNKAVYMKKTGLILLYIVFYWSGLVVTLQACHGCIHCIHTVHPVLIILYTSQLLRILFLIYSHLGCCSFSIFIYLYIWLHTLWLQFALCG